MLKPDHALAKLDGVDGFRIKEPMNPLGLSPTVAALVSSPTIAGFGVDKLEDIFQHLRPRENPPRPLREAIPYTKGRLEDWRLVEHVRSAKARNWPGIKINEFPKETVAICGGGDSIGHFEQLKTLRALQKKGAKIVAINRTHDWLMTKGIVPWAGVLLDPVPNVANYITPRRGIRYYVGSQCHPSTFDNFDKSDVQKIIWHAASVPALQDELTEDEKTKCVPANGSTCGLRSILLFYLQGFRTFHLFGFDSCFATNPDGTVKLFDGKPRLHAYPKPEAILDSLELTIPELGEKKYYGNTMMLSQADEFQEFLVTNKDAQSRGLLEKHAMWVHGTGLIPDIARYHGNHYDQRKVKNGLGLHT